MRWPKAPRCLRRCWPPARGRAATTRCSRRPRIPLSLSAPELAAGEADVPKKFAPSCIRPAGSSSVYLRVAVSMPCSEPAGRQGAPMRDDLSVSALVARAQDGDQPAWNELVERYAPLVWSICNRYRLRRPDIDDIAQTVWLLLVEQLGNIRKPAALPGWLATTTQRECLRVLRVAGRYDSFGSSADSQVLRDQSAPEIEQEVIEAELRAALRTAFVELPARCRQLLSMLISDPPHSYAEISATVPI